MFGKNYVCEGQMSLTDWMAAGKTTAASVSASWSSLPVGKEEKEKNKGEIKDFGERIYGARKDLWSGTDSSSVVFTREDIWKKPNYKKLYSEGRSRALVWYIKRVYEAIPRMPKIPDDFDEETRGDINCQYSTMVSEIRDRVLNLPTIEDITWLNHFLETNGYITILRYSRSYTNENHSEYFVSSKLVNVFRKRPSFFKDEAKKKRFLFTPEEKVLADFRIYDVDDVTDVVPATSYSRWHVRVNTEHGIDYCYSASPEDISLFSHTCFITDKGHNIVKSGLAGRDAAKRFILDMHSSAAADSGRPKDTSGRKKAYQFPHLSNVQRTGGTDYRHGKDISGDDYLKDFKFRGGQFGNWLGQKERQEVLNMGYDAMMDLSKALQITPQQLTGNGKLAIAFGARGHGRALAHFEPLECVINLTRMRGAGSLGHEMIHFLDYLIGRNLGYRSFLTRCANSCSAAKTPDSYFKLIHAIKGPVSDRTRFYQDACCLDGQYSKSDKGYWNSDIELLARAGAAYIKDKLASLRIRNDYLCGHADSVKGSYKGEPIFGSPQGDERETINTAFDEFFTDMKNRKLL